MERYRSGHNEAVLKTVCPQGRVGSNPTLSVHNNLIPTMVLGFWRSTQEAEGTPLERVQVVNSGARVQIPPSPFGERSSNTMMQIMNQFLCSMNRTLKTKQ